MSKCADVLETALQFIEEVSGILKTPASSKEKIKQIEDKLADYIEMADCIMEDEHEGDSLQS